MDTHIPSQRANRRIRTLDRLSVRTILIALVLATMLAPVGWTVQSRATAEDSTRFPPPGQLVDVGGYKLHLQVMGVVNTNPTVILEAGLGDSSPYWAWVQEEIAQLTQVLSYDRAGLGWSETGTRPRTARHMAQELHAALDAAHIEGPYILVGHSFGGLLVRMFEELYSDEVVGIVFVDSSHHEQFQRFPWYAVAYMRVHLWQSNVNAWLARFGLTRLGTSTHGDGLPARQEEEYEAFDHNLKQLNGVRQEAAAWERVMVEVAIETGDLGDLPVISLSASQPEMSVTHAFQQMHAELAALSTQGEHRIIPESEHTSLLIEREDAHYVITAIQDVLATVGKNR